MLGTILSHWSDAVGAFIIGALAYAGVKLQKIAKTTKATKDEVKNDHSSNIRDDIDKNIDLSKEAVKAVTKLDEKMDAGFQTLDRRLNITQESLVKEIHDRQVAIDNWKKEFFDTINRRAEEQDKKDE